MPNSINLEVIDDTYSPKSIKQLVALMLTSSPENLPEELDFRYVPDWLRPDLCLFIHQFVDFFEEPGQSEKYFRVRASTAVSIADCLKNEPRSPYHKYLAIQMMQIEFLPRYVVSESELKEMQCRFSELFEMPLRSMQFVIEYKFPPSDPTRKARIGFLFNDLADTADTRFNLSLLENLRPEFEVVLFLLSQEKQAHEDFFVGAVDRLHRLSSDFDKQAEELRSEELDVLVFACDFSLNSQWSTLATGQMARYQMIAGSPISSGMKSVDGVLVGDREDIELLRSQFSEQPINVPGIGMAYSSSLDTKKPVPSTTRATLNIPEEAVVYFSSACLFDIRPELLLTWLKILGQLPQSVLLLTPFDPSRSNLFRHQNYYDSVSRRFAEHGIDPSRLRMLVPDPFPTFSAIGDYVRLADVCLDAFPVCRPGFAVSSLREAVPIVTWEGAQRRSYLSSCLIRDLSPEIAEKLGRQFGIRLHPKGRSAWEQSVDEK